MKSLITRHPIALGLLAGAALIAIFGAPVEAGQTARDSRGAAHNQSCCDGPHRLTLRRQTPPKHRAWRVAWNSGTGTGTRTGSGTSTGSGSRFFFDPRSGTYYLMVIPRSYEIDHSSLGPGGMDNYRIRGD